MDVQIIVGTRITVSAIIQYYKQGKDIDKILELLPHLHPAQLHDAFSYYYEHHEEIEVEISQDNDEAYWQKKYPPGKRNPRSFEVGEDFKQNGV